VRTAYLNSHVIVEIASRFARDLTVQEVISPSCKLSASSSRGGSERNVEETRA